MDATPNYGPRELGHDGSSLARIAGHMRDCALRNPYDPDMPADRKRMYAWRLRGGLALELIVVGGQWQLSLARPNVPPSLTELRVILSVFRVPAEYTTRPEQKDGWSLVRIRWGLTALERELHQRAIARG